MTNRDWTCPLLYCTWSWYSDRRIPCGAPNGHFRQFRPSQTEFTALLQMGVTLGVAQHGDAIVPNTAHPIVDVFLTGQNCSSANEPEDGSGEGGTGAQCRAGIVEA
jgi:hypothetical protein